MDDDGLRSMVLDYMEKGFLENIVDLFRRDETLYPLILDMIKDDRLRVRLGATALVEELARERPEPLVRLIPALAGLLKDGNPTVRGDGANLLDIVGHADALPFLAAAAEDEDRAVREIVQEAIQKISGAEGAPGSSRVPGRS